MDAWQIQTKIIGDDPNVQEVMNFLMENGRCDLGWMIDSIPVSSGMTLIDGERLPTEPGDFEPWESLSRLFPEVTVELRWTTPYFEDVTTLATAQFKQGAVLREGFTKIR